MWILTLCIIFGVSLNTLSRKIMSCCKARPQAASRPRSTEEVDDAVRSVPVIAMTAVLVLYFGSSSISMGVMERGLEGSYYLPMSRYGPQYNMTDLGSAEWRSRMLAEVVSCSLDHVHHTYNNMLQLFGNL